MTKSQKYVIHGAPEPEIFANGVQSLAEFLKNRLAQQTDFITLINGISDEHLTSSELLRSALRVSASLNAHGIRDADSVVLCSENRLESAIAMIGTLLHGATLVPMSPTYSTPELQHAFQLTRPKMIFVSADAQAAVQTVATRCAFVQTVVALDALTEGAVKTIAWRDFVGDANPERSDLAQYRSRPQRMTEKVAVILFSSGTTGVSKGVELTEKNLLASVAQHEHFADPEASKCTPEITVLTIAPWSHGFGCMSLLARIVDRTRIVFLPKFVPDHYLAAIQRHRCNTADVVPPLMVFLAKHPLVARFDLSSLRVINCAAAPLGAQLVQAVCRRIGCPIVRQGYGLTESTTVVTKQTTDRCKSGSVGVLWPGNRGRVVDMGTGLILPANQRGELQFSGPAIMRGYVDDRKATEATVDADGWLRTGDIGYYDEDGEWFIVDRLKELIKFNGFQVPPAELEGILLQHPGISDAAVVGVPDELVGELPMAFVVRQAGAVLTEREVCDFVAERSSRAKRLHGGVRFVATIPKNASGKIMRRELRQQLKPISSKL